MERLAQSIRKVPHVTGISLGTSEHRIDLNEDDIIIMVSQTDNSLRIVQHLQEISAVLFYKFNETKSQILFINVPPLRQSFLAC